MQKNVVPLVEVAEHSDVIRVLDLDMPGVPIEDLQLDVARTERVMHWGGIKFLTMGSNEGEGTEYTATGFNFGADGSIGATGQKIAKKARFADASSDGLHKNSDYNWRNTAVYFNSTALKEKSLEGEPAQAKQLDRAFRATLGKEIFDHEMSLKNVVSEVGNALYFTAVLYGIDFILPGVDFIGSDSLPEVVTQLMLPKLAWPLLMKLGDSVEKGIGIDRQRLRPKYSTMFSFRVDRVALATRHLAAHKLITLSSTT